MVGLQLIEGGKVGKCGIQEYNFKSHLVQLNASVLKRFVSLKGFFSSLLQYGDFSLSFCLTSGVADCVLTIFSCPPASTLFVERGPSPPPSSL